MIKLLAKFISYSSFAALLASAPLHAMEIDTDNSSPHFPSVKKNDIPKEVLFSIYDFLPENDLKNLELTCNSYKGAVVEYIVDRTTADYSVYGSMRDINEVYTSLSDDRAAYVLLRFVKDQNFRNLFLKKLKEKEKNQPIRFVENGSFLSSLLQQQLPSLLDEVDLIRNFDVANELYQALFQCPLPLDNMETALNHLLAVLPLQDFNFPDDNAKQKGLKKFFKANKENLRKQLIDLRKQQPYCSFIYNELRREHELKYELPDNQTYNIVLTMAQLAKVRNSLKGLYSKNPNYTYKNSIGSLISIHTHPLIVSIGKRTSHSNNELSLLFADYQILNGWVKNLYVVDRKGIVNLLAKNFLSSSNEILTSLRISFPNLTEIQDGFLSSCRKLTSLQVSFPNLKVVGKNFLSSCEGLTSLRLLFPNLTEIQNSFLSLTKGITSLQMLFPNLTKIQDTFLLGCGITSLQISFPNLESIEDDFLKSCENLTSLRVSFPKLKTIGTNFLQGCPKLTFLEMLCPNLTKIQQGFYLGKELKEFILDNDTASLKDIKERLQYRRHTRETKGERIVIKFQ